MGARPETPDAISNGLVDWLLACPDKGFFVPLDSEPTTAITGTDDTSIDPPGPAR